MTQKAFKFRCYPTAAQAEALAVQFGHARFVYNHYRAVREEFYIDTGRGLSYRDCADDLAERLKDEHSWLRAVDSQVLQQALLNLDNAYTNFFEHRAKYPRFKRKDAKQSIRSPQRFKIQGSRIDLSEVGWVKAVFHRPIAGVMKSCTVPQTKSGRYFAPILHRIETPEPLAIPDRVGLDLGLTTFATLSTGEKIVKPKYLKATGMNLKKPGMPCTPRLRVVTTLRMEMPLLSSIRCHTVIAVSPLLERATSSQIRRVASRLQALEARLEPILP